MFGKHLCTVSIGPINECRKLVERIQVLKEDAPKLHCFVNFNVKESENNIIAGQSLTNENSQTVNQTSLLQICSEKVLTLFEQNKLRPSDIIGIPAEIWQKILNYFPLLVPVKKADPTTVLKNTNVLPVVELNFTARDHLIAKINELRPELPLGWLNDTYDAQEGLVYCEYHRSDPDAVAPEILITFYEGIKMRVIGRKYTHHYTRYADVFIIENQQVIWERFDQKKTFLEDDHTLFQRYGHLFPACNENRSDAHGTDFDTKEFGTFTLVYNWQQQTAHVL